MLITNVMCSHVKTCGIFALDSQFSLLMFLPFLPLNKEAINFISQHFLIPEQSDKLNGLKATGGLNSSHSKDALLLGELSSA